MATSAHNDGKRRPLGPSVPPPATTFAGPSAPVLLVVEDDEAMRTMLARMLGDKYTVFAAADGVAALDLLAQIQTPDAIVLDVMMPRIDGFELARRIKADPKLQRVPILYLTAKAGPLDVIAGINAGARHYLTKPFKMPELLERLGRMVVPRS
ncbi:MAG TPA: response regulator [Polyangiaceae bacterium]